MIYPLQNAVARNRVIRYASDQAVDRAMRALHDGPEVKDDDPDEIAGTLTVIRRWSPARYHLRMKVDESNCRWCGLAAREALAEIGDEDE